MELRKTLLQKMALLMVGGLFLVPLSSGANDAAGHDNQTTGHVADPQSMGPNMDNTLRLAVSDVSAAERSYMGAQSQNHRAGLISARQELLDSERLLTSLIARQARLPYSTVENMHSSGVSFSQIGFDLQIPRWSEYFVAGQEHTVVVRQVNNNLDMSNIGMNGDHMLGDSSHSSSVHGDMGENVSSVITASNRRGSVGRTYTGQSWDDHHNNVHGYSGPSNNGSYNNSYSHQGQSNGAVNYRSNGGMMSGMH